MENATSKNGIEDIRSRIKRVHGMLDKVGVGLTNLKQRVAVSSQSHFRSKSVDSLRSGSGAGRSREPPPIIDFPSKTERDVRMESRCLRQRGTRHRRSQTQTPLQVNRAQDLGAGEVMSMVEKLKAEGTANIGTKPRPQHSPNVIGTNARGGLTNKEKVTPTCHPYLRKSQSSMLPGNKKGKIVNVRKLRTSNTFSSNKPKPDAPRQWNSSTNTSSLRVSPKKPTAAHTTFKECHKDDGPCFCLKSVDVNVPRLVLPNDSDASINLRRMDSTTSSSEDTIERHELHVSGDMAEISDNDEVIQASEEDQQINFQKKKALRKRRQRVRREDVLKVRTLNQYKSASISSSSDDNTTNNTRRLPSGKLLSQSNSTSEEPTSEKYAYCKHDVESESDSTSSSNSSSFETSTNSNVPDKSKVAVTCHDTLPHQLSNSNERIDETNSCEDSFSEVLEDAKGSVKESTNAARKLAVSSVADTNGQDNDDFADDAMLSQEQKTNHTIESCQSEMHNTPTHRSTLSISTPKVISPIIQRRVDRFEKPTLTTPYVPGVHDLIEDIIANLLESAIVESVENCSMASSSDSYSQDEEDVVTERPQPAVRKLIEQITTPPPPNTFRLIPFSPPKQAFRYFPLLESSPQRCPCPTQDQICQTTSRSRSMTGLVYGITRKILSHTFYAAIGLSLIAKILLYLLDEVDMSSFVDVTVINDPSTVTPL